MTYNVFGGTLNLAQSNPWNSVISDGCRLQKLISSRQQDKQNLAILDRRVQEERKQKMTLEQQLMAEKRRKTDDASRKADDSSRAAVAVASSSR